MISAFLGKLAFIPGIIHEFNLKISFSFSTVYIMCLALLVLVMLI